MNSDHVRSMVLKVKNGDLQLTEALARVIVEVAKGRVHHAQGCLKPLLEIIPSDWGGDESKTEGKGSPTIGLRDELQRKEAIQEEK